MVTQGALLPFQWRGSFIPARLCESTAERAAVSAYMDRAQRATTPPGSRMYLHLTKPPHDVSDKRKNGRTVLQSDVSDYAEQETCATKH